MMQAWAALVLAAAAKRAATKTTLSARLPLLFVCLLWYKGAVTKLEFQPHSQSLAKPKKGCIVQPRVRDGGTDKVLCTPPVVDSRRRKEYSSSVLEVPTKESWDTQYDTCPGQLGCFAVVVPEVKPAVGSSKNNRFGLR